MPQDNTKHPILLPHHAFVVQFHAQPRIKTGQAMGRVEHVVSRQSVAFESLETMLAFMDRVLNESKSSEEAGL